MEKCRMKIVILLLLPALIMTSCRVDEKMGKNALKIASLSFVPKKWEKQVNLDRIESLSREAAAEGAKIIVTSEGAVEGYLINEVLKEDNKEKELEPRFFEIAETLDGPAVRCIANLAVELNVDIILGLLERKGKILYNSVVWLNSAGKIVHVHRKTHMAQAYFQPEFYHPGDSVQAFDTDYGRFGMMICYERQVPEVATALALDGAQILFNPSYGSRGEWNDIMLRTRARDNNTFLIFTHPQQTLIIDPDGKVLLNNNDQEGISYIVVDLKSHKTEKLAKRRPQVFLKKLAIELSDSSKTKQ
jgi:predicted amidohydrolase